jgi:nucleotide-binding universal stress UspA family protein
MKTQAVVLVPLDGSEASRTALPAARRAASALAAHSETPARVEALHVTDAALLDEQALLDTLQLAKMDLAGGRALQASGDVAGAIRRAATEYGAWLLVMSSHGSSARRDNRLGSIAAAVIQTAACPVLVVRPDMPEPRRTLAQIDHVLVPLDGSPGASMAVPIAAALGRSRSADLDLLHVATAGTTHPSEAGTLLGPRYLDAPQYEWPEWAREFLERFGPTPAAATGGHVRVHAAGGDPGDEIVQFAATHETDLIGIAWQQALEPGRARVVKRLLEASPCPLLFVPAVGQPAMGRL